MQGFFWLAPASVRNDGVYRESIVAMCRQIGMAPVFSDASPPERSRIEWLSEQLNGCEFAFFDLTGSDPDALIAFGVGSECEAQCYAFQDPDVTPAAHPMLAGHVTRYYGSDDFQRRVRVIITDAKGASTINQRQLVEKIRAKLTKHGPLPMRGIARELGYHPSDIKAVVYSMVSEKTLTKLSDKRWTHYSVS